ncbi:hypothetical protein NW755_011939 [Fusarium falciforme]|uniref:FAD-binding PCMH-type domain-containing protein n=1 Tax=Fusarium falciforme TaxID=195108 RepID=A0A9W8QWB1_9HYPO|nr:hypothetical protein NW755_011939 [Fusarium falciforme]
MWLLTAFATVSLFSQASGYLSFGSHQGLFEVEKRESSSQNDGTNWSCVSACKLLATTRPNNTLGQDSADYINATSEYWTNAQINARPRCFFQPENARDVSVGLQILRHASCSFTIKSGGHGKFYGESSINNGVVVDMVKINHVTVSRKRDSVAVGAGNRWGAVYDMLEPLGLTVVGGRATSVGVGGFLLGGGISYFSNNYGWGADNIISFEVVIADGSIITASQLSHPDLYRALKGGAANFGIVTSFNLKAYPYIGMWGGFRGFLRDNATVGSQLQEAFMEFGSSSHKDPKAAYLLAVAQNEGQWIWGSSLIYTEPVEAAPAFDKVLAVPGALIDTLKIQNQTNLAFETWMQYPQRAENTLWTVSTKTDIRLVNFFFNTWVQEMERIQDVKDLRPNAVVQFITKRTVQQMSKNGGNALGLGEEPFLMFNAEPSWSKVDDSPKVFSAIQNVMTKVKDEARRLGQEYDYEYTNYASQYQDPISTYGSAVPFLRGTAANYDPEGVFQKLRSGGFKLYGGRPERQDPQA